jgi:hypothetical protein
MVRCSFPVVVGFFISSCVGIATASTSEVNDSPKVPLGENWFIQPSADVPADGAAISAVGFSTRGWYPATIPSTVLSALVADKVYPDPYTGMNCAPSLARHTPYLKTSQISRCRQPAPSVVIQSGWYRVRWLPVVNQKEQRRPSLKAKTINQLVQES